MEYLEMLLAPIGVRQFIQDYYEKKPLYISRNDTDYYQEILAVADLDNFFQLKFLPYQSIRLVKAHQEIEYGKWVKMDAESAHPQVQKEQVFYFLHQGYSIILNRLQEHVPKLHQFMSQINHELAIGSTANIYITPPNDQCFDPHYDAEDVIVLQISGQKRWFLYGEAIHLPNRNTPVVSITEHEEVKHTYDLLPGDLLYIPRGEVHNAITTDTTSIHITFTLKPSIGASLIRHLNPVLNQNEFFRSSIVPQTFSQDELQDYVTTYKKELIAEIERMDWADVISKQLNYNKMQHGYSYKGRFTEAVNHQEITADHQVALRSGVQVSFEMKEHFVYVKFGGKQLYFPVFMKPFIEGVLTAEVKNIATVPSTLDLKSKLKLVQKFITLGILEVYR